LIVIGCVMAIVPLLYAAMEDDLRAVLAHCLNNQLGFMVIGVGVGTELALNGVAAQAFCHILYKSLLFMSVGAVLYRVGHCRASQLGGLAKSMPWTMVCCGIGAAAISVPFFCGFVSKSLILSSLVYEHMKAPWLILLFASAGVFIVSGLKIVVQTFWGVDRGIEVEEAPRNMRLAMGLTAALCIGVGCWYQPLYHLLPYPVKYEPYTAGHLLTQMQLLLLASLAYALIAQTRLHPKPQSGVNLDVDWFYRKPLFAVAGFFYGCAMTTVLFFDRMTAALGRGLHLLMLKTCGPESRLAQTQTTSSMAFYAAVILALILIMHYWG